MAFLPSSVGEVILATLANVSYKKVMGYEL